MTEDEMAGWHHRLNGCEFEQAPGDGEEQRSLVVSAHPHPGLLKTMLGSLLSL